MSNDTTLFAHIVPWLTDSIENVAVEALGYILSNSEAARTALAETVKDGGIEAGSIDRVETWEIGDEGATPDLVCFDGDDSQNVLIEAKFWAGLTKNQPNQYLEQLREKSQESTCCAPCCRAQDTIGSCCGRNCVIGQKKSSNLTAVSDSGLGAQCLNWGRRFTTFS